jgi:putative polyhydroxyalkanoate system protein
MAKTITVDIHHDLGAAEARRRLESGIAGLATQVPGGLSNLQQSWAGDVLSFSALVMGQAIAGRLHVLERSVRVDLDLPGLLGMMAGKIKGALQKQGQLLLEKK